MTERDTAAWRMETRARLLAARTALSPEEHGKKSARVLAGVQMRLQQHKPGLSKAAHPVRSEGPSSVRTEKQVLRRIAPQDDPSLGLGDTAPKLSQVIAAYWPMQGEVDLHPLFPWLIEQGGTPALPAVVGRGLPLQFRAWKPGDALEPGPFNTQHPATRDLVHPDVLLIPVVGFDEHNYRLGYGGGYYDRTLAAMNPRPLTIGLGFELSRLSTIHPQPCDIPLDCIVTESSLGVEP